MFKRIMREDAKLTHCENGIATLITRKLSKELSNKEWDCNNNAEMGEPEVILDGFNF